jgi:hypothetical protein
MISWESKSKTSLKNHLLRLRLKKKRREERLQTLTWQMIN